MKGKRIYVGLSGGVDSAVTAAILKEASAQVTGVFIQGWYPPELPCSWREDRRDAMRVAARLQIPFRTLDASKEYKQSVIDYLIREYGAGRTPNPDIFCNRDVKFGAFHAYAMQEGADAIATGHYARVEFDGTDYPKVFRGIDEDKDQSYFLWAVSKVAFQDTLMPLGFLTKASVRKLADYFALPVAKKKDSQGICFLGAVSIDEFLRVELGTEQGKAVDLQGNELGSHDGAVLYTLGERIALPDAPSGPWYVVRKDLQENIVVVSKERTVENSSVIRYESSHWWDRVSKEEAVIAQYRYHGPHVPGKVDAAQGIFVPDAPLPEPAASGQSIVFYRGDRLVGGAIIS